MIMHFGYINIIFHDFNNFSKTPQECGQPDPTQTTLAPGPTVTADVGLCNWLI